MGNFGSKSRRRAVPRRQAKEGREFWCETHSLSRSRGGQKIFGRGRGHPSCSAIYTGGNDRSPARGAVWIALERREYRGKETHGESGPFEDTAQERGKGAAVPIRSPE